MKLKSTLRDLSALICDKDYAAGFQSVSEYRKALNDVVWGRLRIVLAQEAGQDNAEPKLHYYAFSFASGVKSASVYIGWPDFPVTMAKIEKARAGLNLGASVLVSCCYLGHMTKSQMVGGES